MGILRGPIDLPLHSRNLVGRSGRAEVRTAHHSTSAEHAVIWWDGDAWRIRDLDSRNGTSVGGEVLGSRDEVELRTGDVVRFGRGGAWTFVDDAPPKAVAVRLGSAEVQASGALLALPSPDDVRVSVFRDHRGWVIEGEEGVREALDLEEVAVGGAVYRLYLPEGLDRTTLEQPATLDASTLEIGHTPDEEHVQVRLCGAATEIDLGARAHHYLLLVLARLRLRDAEQGVEEEQQGWVHRDVLLDMLRADRKVLNLQVFRLREALGAAGVVDAGGIVERRRGNDQLRLGVERVRLLQL